VGFKQTPELEQRRRIGGRFTSKINAHKLANGVTVVNCIRNVSTSFEPLP
jgi:hypothetical protein